MAVISGFFNASEDASGKRDRVYSAEDFGAIFDGVISDGIFEKYPNSVYNSTTKKWEPFKVIPGDSAIGSLKLTVKPGRAWLNKTWTLNDSDYTVTLDSRDANLLRMDGIFIKIDKSERINSIIVTKGPEDPVRPVLITPTDVPGQTYYHLIAKVLVNGSQTDVDTPITAAEITNMIGVSGGTPYVESLVTDPDVTVDTIMNNLESRFNSYQSEFTDEFNAWFDSVKDSLDELTNDQVITIAEMIANMYSTDYLSGQYPYLENDCLFLSSDKTEIPPILINFGFVTGSMYPNKNANELTVYTGEIQTGE